MLKIDIDYLTKSIRNLNDMQLVSCIDEFKQLRDNEDVYKLCFWNDVNKLLWMMYDECFERMKKRVKLQDEI